MYTYKRIKTDKDYEEAFVELEKVFHAQPGSPQEDHLKILGLLIEEYEEENYPMPKSDPIEAIKYQMDQQGLTVSDLGKIIGYTSRASEILNRKRRLTLGMIRKLSSRLHIAPELLIKEYSLA